MPKPLTYYVMLCPSFDCETLIAHRPTFEGAVVALLEEHKHLPEAALSVWDSAGNLLVPSVSAAKALRDGASHG